MENNEIMVIYGKDYQSMTIRLLEASNLAERIPSKTAKIAIKPNLVAPAESSTGATTHVEVVEALILYLKKYGFRNIVIMESSWVGDRTSDSYSICGYNQMAERQQIPLLDMKKYPGVSVDCAGMELTVAEPALNCDFLINVPVMKGHCQTRMTCALKNMKGLLPDAQKRAFHRMGLHDPIGHLSAGIHQDFILVDSICGDLNFEDGGSPVEQNRLFTCLDPVLCDTYCLSLMGIPLEEVPYISIAESCGVGSTDLSHASVTELNHQEKMPISWEVGKALQVSAICEEVESCSACYGSLIPALYRLSEEGVLPAGISPEEKICIGQGYQGKTGFLGIGQCTRNFRHTLKGCPPKEEEIYQFLKAYYTN